ncbi:SDR family oxidoreductase [Brevibacterium sp. 91QC2O2]|uniref:SDR family NAD(P)-dependent oxidoreductase n=1 Tax=Brevibacterium TaxID=1696 RepID=UPI00211BB642|nr:MULTISPECIES: SDR family oxidoreductase [unclassified Brevibacterium]MCQ9369402.1 SDR family oxidoreductase [Brevibacterium sp. 91QC2O2]MCQ9386933.1 SDR family oxidoreductase [Brevibacterium sp. 68QC2CO]
MSNETLKQDRRVAIVTGAAQGIGAAVAERLLREGLAVAAVDIDGKTLEGTAARLSGFGPVHAITADVRQESAVEAVVESTVTTLGKPTVLVNDAGYIRDNLLFKMDLNDWDEVMDIHLRAPFMLTHAVQGFMVEAQNGRIVNLSSIAALGNRGQVNYSAAKAGIQGFTRTLSLELGRYGITANAIAPGFVETAMTRQTAERIGVPFEDMKKQAESQIALRRVAQPEDIANIAAFLISSDADYVTGQIVYATGGPTV